jgi:hypothetical protein
VHLIYQVNPVVEEELDEPKESEDTPALPFVATMAALMMAAVTRRND